MLAFITDLLTKVRVSELTFSEKRGSVSYVVVAEAVRCAARAFARSCRSDLPFRKKEREGLVLVGICACVRKDTPSHSHP